MRTPLGVALALGAALVAPRRAAAEAGSIAILPITASEPRLALYTRPIAGVVAAGLARATGARVEVVAAGSVPPRAAWIIDGRIVAHGRGEIMIEARLRDPARGSAAGTVSSRARPLRQVDRLAGELVRDLAALYATAEADRLRAARPVASPPTPSTHAAGPPPVATAGVPAAAAGLPAAASLPPGPTAPPGDGRPLLLLGQVRREIGGIVELAAPATLEARRIASRLGYAVAAGGPAGIASGAEVAAALALRGASLALLVEVVDLDVVWRGVLSARGVVRVAVVDRGGRTLYDRLIRTDTVVGSRGDRHPALLHFVLEQVFDIVLPELRRVLPS